MNDTPVSSRMPAVIFALATFASIAIPFSVRLSQYASWKQEPERYFVNDKPLLTSLDGYYWISLADDRLDGRYDAMDDLRSWPDGAGRPPLAVLPLSVAAATRLTGSDPFRVSVWLFPLLSSLFVLPLALYFRRLALPAAGLLGGLVGTFAAEYYGRSSIGAVDADALNLFFPILASLLVLEATGSRRRVWVSSALCGATLLVYSQWYMHHGFTVVYLVVLLVTLTVRRRSYKTIGGAAGIFAVAANPVYVFYGFRGLALFLGDYVTRIGRSPGVLSLPVEVETNTSGLRAGLGETLTSVLDPGWLVLPGLAAFAVLATICWKRMLPLAPVVALGLLALTSGRRFAMYLGPLVGIGYGWLVAVALERFAGRKPSFDRWREPLQVAAAFALFAMLYGATGAGYVAQPAPSSRLVSAVRDVAAHAGAGSVVLTWWDYGYPLRALGRLATFHDGSRRGIKTLLVARALAASRPEALQATVADIEAMGEAEILERLQAAHSPQRALEALGVSGRVNRDDVYLVLFGDMVLKYAAIHRLGHWDVESGTGPIDGYQKLKCGDWPDHRILCDVGVIDTTTGTVGPGTQLEKLILIRGGKVDREVSYGPDTGLFLQILTNPDGEAYGFYLMTEAVHGSNFNRLYFLDDPVPAGLERVHEDFPTYRLYRFRR